MQKRLEEKVAENIKYYELEVDENNQSAEGGGGRSSQADAAAAAGDSHHDPDIVDADLATGNKDTCVLEIDDTEDADIVDSLMDQFPPASIQVYSIEEPVGIAPGHIVNCCQTFSQVSTIK